MKYAVCEKTNITSIPKETQSIHLVRPINKYKIDELLKKDIQTITLSESCFKRLGRKTLNKFKEKEIELITEKKRGRPLTISLKQMLEIIELRKDYQSIREIEKLTNVPKSKK
jgi:hypothetical protein